jgi:hypothetical protein
MSAAVVGSHCYRLGRGAVCGVRKPVCAWRSAKFDLRLRDFVRLQRWCVRLATDTRGRATNGNAGAQAKGQSHGTTRGNC